jgi:hypothetical protein
LFFAESIKNEGNPNVGLITEAAQAEQIIASEKQI